MKVEIKVPSAGESVTEADIAAWLKEDGEFVEVDDELVELETDKASMPLLAEIAGTLSIAVAEGETVQVGDVIGSITAGEKSDTPKAEAPKQEEAAPAENAAPTESTTQAAPAPNPGPSTSYAAGHPAPAAAKILSEKGIDPKSVIGSGKDGRIIKEDAQKAQKPAAEPKAAAPEKKAIPDMPQPTVPTGERVVRREKMTRIRRTISNRLVEAQQNAALLTTFNEVDMHEVMQLRKQYKEEFKEKFNVGLGFMSFFTKAASIALQEFPVINAQVEDDHIVYHDYTDIGIAVSTPKGLIVPVVRDVQHLSFNQIEQSILSYALRGRDGKILPEDMQGGTFTITNGGVFGSMLSTPIINRPQSAILGMHNIVQRPTVVNGEIKARPIMYLALTYDHRIIDGAQAVGFLVKIKKLIEEPARLMLDL